MSQLKNGAETPTIEVTQVKSCSEKHSTKPSTVGQGDEVTVEKGAAQHQILVSDEAGISNTSTVAAAAAVPTPENMGLAKMLAVCAALGLVCLLVWLDEGIIATAIPSISREFGAFKDIGWYAPSYMFGLCAFQLPFGRLYKDLPSRPTYLGCILLFEVASILQAAAPNSPVFILGRVLAGIGGSGVLSGTLVIFTEDLPSKSVPMVMGCFGWVHGVGSVVGPIVGGAITSSRLTWRWCFWLNPIISIVAILPVLLIWRANPAKASEQTSAWSILKKVDILGVLTSIPSIVALLLALQFGGSVFTWSDARTIACFVVFGVMAVAFVLVEKHKGSEAMVPGSIAAVRVVWLSSLYSAALDGAWFVLVYYAAMQLSARDSSFRILPLLGISIGCNFMAATLAGKLRYYQPFMALGSILLTVGSGLLTTFTLSASIAEMVIFQMIAGAGAGMAMQLPLIAVRDGLPDADIAVGYAVVLMSGYVGSTVALAAAQATFVARLTLELHQHVPSLDWSAISSLGASSLRAVVPPELLDQTLTAYSKSLTQSWYLSVAVAGFSFLLVPCLKWKKMKAAQEKSQNSQA